MSIQKPLIRPAVSRSFSAVLIFLFMAGPLYGEKPFTEAFINTERVLWAYGVSENGYLSNRKLVKAVNHDDLEKIGSFENEKDIDSTAEFVTMAFYSGYTPEKGEYQRAAMEELSSGKMGACKVGAMWLKKRVTDGKFYEEAISFILSKSELSENELLEYYRDAVSAEVDMVVARVMKDIPVSYYTYFREGDPEQTGTKVNAIDLIKEYYFYPSRENYNNLLDAVRYFGRKSAASEKSMIRFRAFIRILDILSPGLREQIVRDLWKDEKTPDSSGDAS